MLEQDERAVIIAHDTFWQSYAKRDLAARFRVCANDVTFKMRPYGLGGDTLYFTK